MYQDSLTGMWESHTDATLPGNAFSASFVLDTANPYSLLTWTKDSLHYGNKSDPSNGINDTEVVIAFNTVSGHIRLFSYSCYYKATPQSAENSEGVTLTDMFLDSTTIEVNDHTLQKHLVQAFASYPASVHLGDMYGSDLNKATEVTITTLSGSMTLSDGASVSPNLNRPKLPISCFPNPISRSTTLILTVAAPTATDVKIVNILGAEVARLFSGELGEGDHSFTWSKPAGLPDGVYQCVVRMNGQVKTLPLVTVR